MKESISNLLPKFAKTIKMYSFIHQMLIFNCVLKVLNFKHKELEYKELTFCIFLEHLHRRW